MLDNDQQKLSMWTISFLCSKMRVFAQGCIYARINGIYECNDC